MSMILNSQPKSDHPLSMNDRTWVQERWTTMNMILNSQPQSDHLLPVNDRIRAQE